MDSQWVSVVGVVLMCLRAVAATVSKHVPDQKLGALGPAINALGGNGKYASNAAGKAPRSKLFGSLLLVGVIVLGGCAMDPNTGERQVDPDKCKSIVDMAERAVVLCPAQFTEPQDIAICEDSAIAMLATARALCNIAEPIEGDVQ